MAFLKQAGPANLTSCRARPVAATSRGRRKFLVRAGTLVGGSVLARRLTDVSNAIQDRALRMVMLTLVPLLQEPGATVLVAGATGGVGQIVCAKLLERGFKVNAVARSRSAGVLDDYGPDLKVVQADLRDPVAVGGLFKNIDAIVCATGTTAFPSDRWVGDNGPRPTDWEANSNLINIAAGAMKAAQGDLARFVFVTSAGVERQKELPWAILNLYGVLKYKRDSEQLLMKSGLPYTIIRPSRLTDGPYTSYDLNTLLQATAGNRQDVTLSLSDSLSGEASRIVVAEAVVQALTSQQAENKAFALCSKEGNGPGTDEAKWKTLFANAQIY